MDHAPFGLGNDISAGTADLGPLADSGGTTETHLPGSSSDAVDAGPLACASPDQRNEFRPQNGVCDIGAVEVVPPPDVCFSAYTGQLQQAVGGVCNSPYLIGIVFEDFGPHYLCANAYTGMLAYSTSSVCPPYGQPAIEMPAAAPLSVCLSRYSGKYRLPRTGFGCTSTESAVDLS